MNNSFPRLVEGMIEALRTQILPHTEGEFARGQIFGVIFALTNLKQRASWSPMFLGTQLDHLDQLRAELDSIADLPAAAPRPAIGTRPLIPDEMEQVRDAGDAAASELIAWLDGEGDTLSPNIRKSAYAAIDRYVHRQLKHEIATSAKPMFAEISSGRDTQTERAA